MTRRTDPDAQGSHVLTDEKLNRFHYRARTLRERAAPS